MDDFDNLREIAENIYSKEPLESNGIQLQLEENAENVDEMYIFNIIYLITFYGIKYLYGEDIEILALSKEQFDVIKKYVRSYGYELVILANDTNRDPWEIKGLGYSINKYNIYFDRLV